MAKERETTVSETGAPALDPTVATMMQAFAAAVAAGNKDLAASIAALTPKPEIVEGSPEYVARQKAEGWFDDFFGKHVYQNAIEAQARGESEQTRRRASQLTSGVYMIGKNKSRKVEVIVNGEDITLVYPIKGDNLLINQQHWNSFEHLIDQLWDAMHTPVPA
jgi:hypothetical protein